MSLTESIYLEENELDYIYGRQSVDFSSINLINLDFFIKTAIKNGKNLDFIISYIYSNAENDNICDSCRYIVPIIFKYYTQEKKKGFNCICGQFYESIKKVYRFFQK